MMAAARGDRMGAVADERCTTVVMSCASKGPQVGAPSGWNGVRSSCRGTRLTAADLATATRDEAKNRAGYDGRTAAAVDEVETRADRVRPGRQKRKTAGRRAAQRGAAWLNATEGSGDSKLGTTGVGSVWRASRTATPT
jgi:hypothetical protein